MGFRKNVSRVVCLSAIFCAAISVPVLAENRGVINDSGVNVRGGSSTDAEVLFTVDKNKGVGILGQEGGFFQVDLDSSAYISSQFVTITSADGIVNDSGVNLRSEPSTDGKVVGQVDKGDTVTVTAQTNNWYVTSNNAYIFKDFLDGSLLSSVKTVSAPEAEATPAPAQPKAAEKKPEAPKPVEEKVPEVQAPVEVYAVVTSEDGIVFRSAASQDSDALGVLPYGEVMDVTAPSDDWVAVSYDGEDGFVKAEFVDVRSGQKPSRSSRGSMGEQVIAYARQFIGTPYVWGGNSLTNGVDCSGFVVQVMKHFGVGLDRSSASMAANDGTPVSQDNLQTGDLLFFDTDGGNNGRVSHVGIYIGGGDFIHSSSSRNGWGITTSSLYEDYYTRTYVSARRVL